MSKMYEIPKTNEPLTQSDIIGDCPTIVLEQSESNLEAKPKRYRTRVIVLTQACDLTQNKSLRVVVGLVHRAKDLVDREVIKSTVIRDQVRRGLAFGLYFLPSTTEPIECPESVVDLRDLHTVPRTILEALIADGKRVCTIASPWREHLAQHFGVTYMRIGLPEPYTTGPIDPS